MTNFNRSLKYLQNYYNMHEEDLNKALGFHLKPVYQ